MEFRKVDNLILFIYTYGTYNNFNNEDWVRESLDEDDSVIFKGTLEFTTDDVYEIELEHDEFDEPYEPIAFVLGELVGDYYKIKRHVIGTKHDFFFFKEINISSSHFIAETRISILKQIDELVKESIYVGGHATSNIPYDAFIKMIENFPTTYEKKLYAESRVSSVIKNYFETTKDSELKLQNYLNKKVSKKGEKLKKLFKESEMEKYQTIQDKLLEMLKDEDKYNETQWQTEILEIILILYPKYICSFKGSNIKIQDNKNRYLDFLLVDYNGNIDVIEIKKPFENAIMTHSQYRGNFTPHKDLIGAIMQLEKYLFNLNRYATVNERRLSIKYKNELPEGLNIKIINPKGFVILGRDNNLNIDQINDFEIVKRKYKNVIDILTYDDLLRRLNFIIEQIRKV